MFKEFEKNINEDSYELLNDIYKIIHEYVIERYMSSRHEDMYEVIIWSFSGEIKTKILEKYEFIKSNPTKIKFKIKSMETYTDNLYFSAILETFYEIFKPICQKDISVIKKFICNDKQLNSLFGYIF